jgi:competence protein ComEC
MSLHNIAFGFCTFFLLGIFFISILNQISLVFLLAVLLSLYFIFFKKYYFALFALIIIVGAFYYSVFSQFYINKNIPFGIKTDFIGVVRKTEQSVAAQKLVLELESPYNGKVKVNVQRYPSFKYGDRVRVTGGIIKKPLPESLNFYKKENIQGIINFPKTELMESGQGNFLKASLLDLKQSIINVFKELLPVEKAAFLSGITLGERQEFSKEFEEKMSLSGTTHLVALSGYNISIIALVVASIFGAWFSRGISFYLSVLVIILFVLMTGAEASVVRAAIMGIIALLAKETERMFSMRNAIVIAAFLMILFNPRVLVFDVGFQLSFAALLGIVYLMPVFKKILKVEDKGFLNWKENALTTVSAQLAVVPLLLGNFGIFSLTSFLANILILSTVPLTMGLGFIMGGLGFISKFLADIVGFAVNMLLSYELWIIDVFSKITLPITTESFGFLAAIVYYLLLVGFIYKFRN